MGSAINLLKITVMGIIIASTSPIVLKIKGNNAYVKHLARCLTHSKQSIKC